MGKLRASSIGSVYNALTNCNENISNGINLSFTKEIVQLIAILN